MAPESLPEPIQVALAFTAMLEQLGVPYVVSGSLASSVHGEPRSTHDIDIVADLQAAHLGPLLAALENAYYVNPEAAADAVRRGTSFNLVHLSSAVKVDLFVVGQDAFDRVRVAQGTPVRLSPNPPASLRVDRVEFTVLRKLEWFRRGGEVSERQWRDVLGMLRMQGSRLDQTLLSEWAPRLGVSDLLERAWREARGNGLTRP